MGRKESKNKAVAEKQEFMGSWCSLTPDFLLSSELVVIGSRTRHHMSEAVLAMSVLQTLLISILRSLVRNASVKEG